MKPEIKNIIEQISQALGGKTIAVFDYSWKLSGISNPKKLNRFLSLAEQCRYSNKAESIMACKDVTYITTRLSNGNYHHVMIDGSGYQNCEKFITAMLELYSDETEQDIPQSRIRTFLVNQLANKGFNQELQEFITKLNYHDNIPRCAILFSFAGKEPAHSLRLEQIFSNSLLSSSLYNKEDMYGLCRDQQFLLFKVVKA